MLTTTLLTIIYFTYFKYRHIKIIKATAKTLVRHAHNAEGNINYRIEIIVKKSSEHMKIEELWIDRKPYKFKITREDCTEHVAAFSEEESLKMEAFEMAEEKHMLSDLPHKFSGAAIIGYWINNKKKYLSVKNIEYLAA